MAAKRNTRNQKQNQGKSLPWGPMLLSFIVGAFVMFLFHLKDNVPADKTEQKVEKKETKKTVEPTFDFYTLLPEMEVVVDEKPKKNVVTAPPAKNVTSPTKTEESFMLQVGSFKKMADADAFRARLALLGVESKVQTVTVDNKDTWHRVQVGPISGRKSADAMQNKLQENGFKPLLMRAKHG